MCVIEYTWNIHSNTESGTGVQSGACLLPGSVYLILSPLRMFFGHHVKLPQWALDMYVTGQGERPNMQHFHLPLKETLCIRT